MKNMKRFAWLLALVLCAALLAGCGSSGSAGRKWSDDDVIDDYDTAMRDGKEVEVCFVHDQEAVYVYTDDSRHRLFGKAVLPSEVVDDETWYIDAGMTMDLTGDGNSDLQISLVHADLSESYIVWTWSEGDGFVYQPGLSWFYEGIMVTDDPSDGSSAADVSIFEGRWLSDADNEYENLCIEIDADGYWRLYQSEEFIDEGYLLYEPVWEYFYADAVTDSVIDESRFELMGDLLYVSELGTFEHLATEDGVVGYDVPGPGQRYISELEGVWYYQGDTSSELYIVIDGYGNWSWYERATGEAEGTEMDYGVLTYTEEDSYYCAESTLYDGLTYSVFEFDDITLTWDVDYTFCKAE